MTTPRSAGASRPRCDRTEAWSALNRHFQAEGRHFDLLKAFAQQPDRFADLGVHAPELFADLSKNLLDRRTLDLLLRLASECEVEGRRDAMLAGETINVTEGRSVLHTALRAPRGQGPHGAEIHAVLDDMLAYAERIRDTHASGIRHVVNIGIGGSDLGPQMAVPALDSFAHDGLQFHFVSNVDGHDLAPVLRKLDPRQTLFVIASKTFTTQETMANAMAAKAWFESHGSTDIARHFVATTTHVAAAAQLLERVHGGVVQTRRCAGAWLRPRCLVIARAWNGSRPLTGWMRWRAIADGLCSASSSIDNCTSWWLSAMPSRSW